MKVLFAAGLALIALSLSGCNNTSPVDSGSKKTPSGQVTPSMGLAKYLINDGFNYITVDGPSDAKPLPPTLLVGTFPLLITGYNDSTLLGSQITLSGPPPDLQSTTFTALNKVQLAYAPDTRSFSPDAVGPVRWYGIAQTSLNLSTDAFYNLDGIFFTQDVRYDWDFSGNANADDSITLVGATGGGTDTQYSQGDIENLAGQSIASVLQLDSSRFPLNNANATFSAGATRFVVNARSLQPYYGLYGALTRQSAANIDDAVNLLVQQGLFSSWWPASKVCTIGFNGLAGDSSQGSVTYTLPRVFSASGTPTGSGTSVLLGVGSWSVANEHGHDMIELSNIPAACAPSIPGAVPLVTLFSDAMQPINVMAGIKVPAGANIGPLVLPNGYAYNNQAAADIVAQLSNAK